MACDNEEVATFPFFCYVGEVWTKQLGFEDDDGSPMVLTGYSAELTISRDATSPSPVAKLTSAPSGGLTINGSQGTIDGILPPSITETIPEEPTAIGSR